MNQAQKRDFDVAMLATVHDATDDRIFYREALALGEAGLSVCIIAPHPASGYEKGIWIEALPRMHNRLRRLRQGYTLVGKALALDPRAVFIFHDPELFPAALALRLCGRTVVYDCHENLPKQVLQKKWLPLPLKWIVAPAAAAMEWLGSRCLSGVLVARDSVLKRFPAGRRISIRNFPTSAALRTSHGPPIAWRPNVVIYAGGLSRVRGITELVEAMRHLDIPAELWLVGAFDSPEYQAEVLASLPDNVKWLGRMQHSEVVKLYASAKIGMCTLHPTPSHRHSQPVKIYEYMGAGLPVVVSNFPEFSELIYQCGVMVDPLDPSRIRQAIREMLLDGQRLTAMSGIARARILDSYCWENEGRRLVQFCFNFLDARGRQRSVPIVVGRED